MHPQSHNFLHVRNLALVLTLNILVNSLLNAKINDSFGILMTSRFQNCPYFFNLMKNYQSYSRFNTELNFGHACLYLYFLVLTCYSSHSKSANRKFLKCSFQMSYSLTIGLTAQFAIANQ